MLRIIDCHTHIGASKVFEVSISEKELLDGIDKNNITAAIVQPFPRAPNVREVHDRIAKLSEEHPGKIFGLANLDPYMDDEEYKAELERLVKDHGFVCVKIHTAGDAVNPSGKAAQKIFETAKRLNIPVMVHTGQGVQFCLPALVIGPAQQYPEVPIILAHSAYGFTITSEVFPVAKLCKNVYLETSWSSILEKNMFLQLIGPNRILYGSDFIHLNAAVELFQFRSLGLSDEDLEKCLFHNANKIFKLKL